MTTATRRRTRLHAVFMSVALAGPVTGALAQTDVADFYRGKTVNVIVGTSPGGGYDLYGRLVARNIGRHIPGNPTVIASNMSGAASIVLTQHIANAALKDGTVIGAVYPSIVTEPLYGDRSKLRYDPTKLNFIGSANSEIYVCAVRSDLNIKDFEDFRTRGLILGASAAGGSTREFPALLVNVFDARFKMVNGYPGSTEISMAIEKNEVQGICGAGWSSIIVGRPQWIRDNMVTIPVYGTPGKSADLDKMGVPNILSLAKTQEQRQVLELIITPLAFGRPFIVAPEVPAARVAALRKAFMEALSDPVALEEAAKMKQDVQPMEGGDVQAAVGRMHASSPEIIAKAKAAAVPSAQ
ncbi:MAG: efflux transporter protein [Hyphomicrobiales bacterium]|nr:efflux transporter protein [Hyphomicrobiales bacterium]